MIPARHNDELLQRVDGLLPVVPGQLEAVLARAGYPGHAQQPVELLHAQRLPLLPARRALQWQLASGKGDQRQVCLLRD